MRAGTVNLPDASAKYSARNEAEFRQILQQALEDVQNYRPEDFSYVSADAPDSRFVPDDGGGSYWLQKITSKTGKLFVYAEGAWLTAGSVGVNASAVQVHDAVWNIYERSAATDNPSKVLDLALTVDADIDRLLLFLRYNGSGDEIIRVGYFLPVPASDRGYNTTFGHTLQDQDWGGEDDATYDDISDIHVLDTSATPVYYRATGEQLASDPEPYTLIVRAFKGTESVGDLLLVGLAGDSIARLADLFDMGNVPTESGQVPVYDSVKDQHNFFHLVKLVTSTPTSSEGDWPGQLLALADDNQAPTSVTALPDQSLEVGSTTTLDLSSYFTDPDGDTLIFSAESLSPTKVTVAVVGSSLTVTAVAIGSAVIEVTASDGTLSVKVEFSTTVTAVTNRAPTLDTNLPDIAVSIGSQAVTQPLLTSYFSDPDNDTLTFTATTSDSSKATAVVTSNKLVITGVAAGTATITVTATDPGGLSVQDTLTATVSAALPATPSLTSITEYRVFGTLAGTDFNFTPGSGGGSVTRYRVQTQGRLTSHNIWSSSTEVTNTSSPIRWNAYWHPSVYNRQRARIRAEGPGGNSAWSAWRENALFTP